MKLEFNLLLKAYIVMANLISRMEEVTIRAMDSANPFAAPIPLPKRVDGRPVVHEREEVSIAPELPASPPIAITEPDVPTVVVEESKAVLEAAPTLFDDIEAPFVKTEIHESRSVDGLPSYRCEFAGRDIFVAWPWYKSSNPVTAAVNVAMALDFGKDKIRFDMAIGDSKIEHARNRLAHKFLETDAKWMVMIDDDIIPSIGRPNWFRYWVHGARQIIDTPLQRHVIHRLIGAGKSLVGAAYFGRQEGGALMASDQNLASRARAYEDIVVPVDWTGTGCILIHRKVFESIRAKYGDSLKLDVPDYDYDYFRPFDSARGEDVSFCQRAKEAGHQPHLDLGLPVFHVGFKTY